MQTYINKQQQELASCLIYARALLANKSGSINERIQMIHNYLTITCCRGVPEVPMHKLGN